MDRYLNALKRHVGNMDAQQAHPRFGIVTSYNPANHTAKVLIQPEEVLSGWLPICTGMTGTGWGIVAPPVIGQQVFIAPHDGHNSAYVILGSVYSQSSAPPKPLNTINGSATSVKPGEVAIVSQDGNVSVRFGADGTLLIVSSVSVNVQTNDVNVVCDTINVASPNINVTATTALQVTSPTSTFVGDIAVTGDITDHNGTRGSLANLRSSYDQHRHNGVQSGGGTTLTTTLPVGV